MTYQEKKEKARQTAIQWQNEFAKGLTISWGVFAIAQNYFEKLGRRYGLIREFRENRIIQEVKKINDFIISYIIKTKCRIGCYWYNSKHI